METKEIIESLEKLASKLGVTAEKLFGFYLKNAKIYKYYFLLELLLSIIGIVIGTYITLLIKIDTENVIISDVIFMIFSGCFLLISAITFLTTIGNFSKFINSFVNAEYEAIKEILRDVIS